MEDTIYVEFNNWMPGIHYPDAEPFSGWMKDDLNIAFNNESWVKENKLCVVRSLVDMSFNFCITANRGWVEQNCPELLAKYTKFLRYPEEDGCVYGQFGHRFLSYSEENIGIIDDMG